jgi:hypothetical protein
MAVGNLGRQEQAAGDMKTSQWEVLPRGVGWGGVRRVNYVLSGVCFELISHKTNTKFSCSYCEILITVEEEISGGTLAFR